MTGQRIDLPKRHGHVTHRDAIWDAIRSHQGPFTSGDIERATRASIHTIRDYLRGLTIAGYLEDLGAQAWQPTEGAARIPTAFQRHQYRLINNVGIDAPKVTRDGRLITTGQARENMWRTMKIIGAFTVQQLCVQASTEDCQIKQQDAKDYIKHLKAARYLKMTRLRGEPTLYRFIPAMNTGPKPPMVQKIKQVYDPNTQTVVWTQGGDA